MKSIEPQRLYRQIAKQIQGLISSGEFAVGSRLPAERDLATQLGFSRPSVREALIALEVEGVIEVRTGSGIYVKSLGKKKQAASSTLNTPAEWGPLEVMRARSLIEAEMAALAAEGANAQDIKRMAAALKAMQKDAKAGRIPRDSDIAFHMAIATACANSVMHDTLELYLEARNGPLFERLGDYFESPASWAAAIAEHQEVLEAIEAHDPQRARKTMQKHLNQAHKRFSASWRSAPSRN
ncbi:MAG: putative L-lactate dehydrogenase operon regulatory protein [Pseudomonadota bacterium]